MLDLNPIYDQLKRIADYMELIAKRELSMAVVEPKEPRVPPAAKQLDLFDTPAATEVPTTTVVVKKPGRPKKDSVDKAKVEDLNAELEKTAEAIVPAATEQDVREGLMRFVQRNTKDEALALLKKYGAMKIKDLKPVDYDPIVAEMKADEELFHGKGKK